jgi:hypothetical protein
MNDRREDTVSVRSRETELQKGKSSARRYLASSTNNESDDIRAELIASAVVVLAEGRPAGGAELSEEITTTERGTYGERLSATWGQVVNTTILVPLALQGLLDSNDAIILTVAQFGRDEGDPCGWHRRQEVVIRAPAVNAHEIWLTRVVRQQIGGDSAILAHNAADNTD